MEAKHAPSARSRTSIRVEHAGRSIEVPLVRDQFEELTADLLERTAYTIAATTRRRRPPMEGRRRACSWWAGPRACPWSRACCSKLTGIEPDRTVNPDEAVARGAALYAGYLLASQAGGGVQPSR